MLRVRSSLLHQIFMQMRHVIQRVHMHILVVGENEDKIRPFEVALEDTKGAVQQAAEQTQPSEAHFCSHPLEHKRPNNTQY